MKLVVDATVPPLSTPLRPSSPVRAVRRVKPHPGRVVRALIGKRSDIVGKSKLAEPSTNSHRLAWRGRMGNDGTSIRMSRLHAVAGSGLWFAR